MSTDVGARLMSFLVARLAEDRGACVSVWAGGLDGTPYVALNADVPHIAASTMKVPLAIAAHRLHERGRLDLDAEVPVHADFGSAVPGARFTMDPGYDQDPETWAAVGKTLTLRELLRRALVLSGNLATNLVLEQVGTREVAQVLADAGCSPHTVVARGIEDAPAREAGLTNVVTAADLARVMAATPPAVEQVLAGQTYRDGIPAGLPDGTRVANKTGWLDGVTHDVALVRPAGGDPFVLVVLTRLDVPTAAADAVISDVARLVWAAR